MSFYNRDRNITGLANLTGITYNPEYGSSVAFEAKNNYFLLSDKHVSLQGAGVNGVIGRYSLNFNLRESDAQKLANFYETQGGTGIFPIQDGSSIYKTLSGTISEFNLLTDNNSKYNISLGFDVERNSSVLNWSGQSFVNQTFSKWVTGQNFAADDIVYFENDLEEPSNNIFYCLSGHVSSLANHPLSTGRFWTKNLFQDPNSQFSVQQKPSVAKNEFVGAFSEKIKHQNNVHSFDSLDLNYKSISDKKLKSILYFLESKLGYKRFEYQIPEIYNRPKTFFAPTWTHKWNYKDSNDLTISVTEDPFGMIPSGKPNAVIVQDSGRSSLGLLVSGKGNLFYDTGNGKTLISGTSNVFLWPSTNIKHSVKLYGRIVGLTGVNQSITRAELFTPENLHLNLSGNSLRNINLYSSPNAERINLANNMISGLDVNGFGNLRFVDFTNNSGSYINIGGCSSLTGVYTSGNVFPQTHVDGAILSLKNGGQYSGYANFIGSSGVSLGTIENISNLSGKGWNIEYEYNPSFIPTTTLAPFTGTTTPPPVGYFYSPNYATESTGACTSTLAVSIYGNSPLFKTSNVINFAGDAVIELGASSFYLSDGNDILSCVKICCDKASTTYLEACPIITTIPPPNTTIPPTTAPPTTSPPTTPPPGTTMPP